MQIKPNRINMLHANAQPQVIEILNAKYASEVASGTLPKLESASMQHYVWWLLDLFACVSERSYVVAMSTRMNNVSTC